MNIAKALKLFKLFDNLSRRLNVGAVDVENARYDCSSPLNGIVCEKQYADRYKAAYPADFKIITGGDYIYIDNSYESVKSKIRKYSGDTEANVRLIREYEEGKSEPLNSYFLVFIEAEDFQIGKQGWE